MEWKYQCSCILIVIIASIVPTITASTTSTKLPPWISQLELPPELLPYHLKRDPILREKCKRDVRCPHREFMTSDQCFGYEDGCKVEKSFSYEKSLTCSGQSEWLRTKRQMGNLTAHKDVFFHQGDFGRLVDHKKHMAFVCTSKSSDGTEIECSDHLKHCAIRNIRIDLKNFKRHGSKRYRSDIIKESDVTGNCDYLNEAMLMDRSDHKAYLQSWGDELQYFKSDNSFKINKENCDVIFDRPTFVIKLDAAINMYHHFCDFVNLYASQHLNGSFDRDVDIVWWDTHQEGHMDTLFGATWTAFTKHKPIELYSLAGKRVCFRDAVFSLLARQRLGLFYNMPLVTGCHGSGLMRAFSKHVLHRLDIHQDPPRRDGKLRVTLMSRSTQFRRILNVDEMISAMEQHGDYVVQVVDHTAATPFVQQLGVDANTDILLAMHGAGLTHSLFLRDWAGVFELYNCDDTRCYDDLARLRGALYRTWADDSKLRPDGPGIHPTNGGAHKKFANYAFDVPEFMRILNELAMAVRARSEYMSIVKIDDDDSDNVAISHSGDDHKTEL